MLRELSLYAYQLERGDFIKSDGMYHRVYSLKGTYVAGRGLLVGVLLLDGWHYVECSGIFSVRRGVLSSL